MIVGRPSVTDSYICTSEDDSYLKSHHVSYESAPDAASEAYPGYYLKSRQANTDCIRNTSNK